MNFPDLTKAEQERLAVLSEELGEAIAAIGKVTRHGYDSCHPDGGEDNRRYLERELGDALAAIRLMIEADDLSEPVIAHLRNRKLARIWTYLHHQPNALARKVSDWMRSEATP